MDRANVDTDQIIPKQFLKRIERTGFGEFLFWDWARNDDGSVNPDFELNEPEAKGASVLLARQQLRLRLEPRARPLGAGGLRLPRDRRAELRRHLLQQLLQERHAADRAQRSPGRGPVPAGREALAGYQLTADLETQTLTDEHGFRSAFEVEPFRRHCLLNGLDDIGLTLEHADKIAEYERAHGIAS